MTNRDLKELRNKFKVGDLVVIPKEFMPYDNYEGTTDKIGEVVAIYRNFFNVRFDESYERSILIRDANFINKLVEHIA